MTAADLTFDSARHEYALPGGRIIPSVTQLLKATGVSVDFEALPNREAIERKRAIGTALHADAHSADDNDLDWATVHEDVRPYLDAWMTCKANIGLRPVARERRVLHLELGYCGTLDGIFETSTGLHILGDLKIGDPNDAAARFQTAGYELAYEQEHPQHEIAARWSIRLMPGLKVPYRIETYTDWNDREVFRAICTTYYARISARRSAA